MIAKLLQWASGSHLKYKPISDAVRDTKNPKSSVDDFEVEEITIARDTLQKARILHQISISFFICSCILLILAATQPWLPKPPQIWHQPKLASALPPPPSLIPTKIDAKLLILNNTRGSLFRAPPSPQVDRVWNLISDTRPIPISKGDVLAAGKDPTKAAKLDPSLIQGSDDAYAGRLDVLHQIHCLNRLRKNVYWDYYFADTFPEGLGSTSEMHRLHLSHCIWYLLQNLMCGASFDIYTHIWTDTFEYPYPDFNINKQCRNFKTVLEFQDKNAIDQDLFEQMRKPEEYGPPAKMVRKFKEIHNWYETHEDDGSEGDVLG